MSSYKAFPPGRGHLQVPLSSRRAALAGLSLYAPCRPRALHLRNACWLLVSRLGTWSLPGRPRPVRPPLDKFAWADFLHHVREEIGSFDDLALYFRSQERRSGFMALTIEGGTPKAFLKVRPVGDPELERESAAVDAVIRSNPRTFHAPAVLSSSTWGDRTILAFAALEAAPHRPAARPPIPEIVEEVSAALIVIPKPEGTPAHWRPSHGDLTPWNLRERMKRRQRGQLTLVDWESAEWAPPASDAVLYHAASRAVLGSADPVPGDTAEARSFWRDRLTRRGETQRDDRLAEAMIAALDDMG